MVALDQIGIATTLVNTLFMGFVLALAFGLGGRHTASEIVETWYQRGRKAAPKMQQAAAATQQQTVMETTGLAAIPATESGGRVVAEERRRSQP